MKKCIYLLLLLIPFIMPKNVFAQVRYDEATPSSAYVLLRWTDQSMSTQSISTESYNGQTYYGFRFGSVGVRYGVMFNYPEKSAINDKYIESIHFSMLMPYFKTDSGDPFNVYLKDTYNNNISCTGKWGVEYPKTEYDGITGNPFSVSRTNYIATYSCYKGHLSGPFSVNLSNEFTNEIGFMGISELSIHYSDGSSQDSSTLNDIKSNTNDTKNNTKETNDLLKNDDTSSAQSTGSSFFNNFQRDSHGLSGIVTAPLRLINSFTTATCNPLEFNLPIVHNHVVLPCMRPIYENYFGVFFSLYQLITTGVVCYGVGINLYSKLRALENPNNDRIEVLQL